MSADGGMASRRRQAAAQAWFKVSIGLARSDVGVVRNGHRRGDHGRIDGGGWLAQPLLQIPCMASHRKPIGTVPLHMESPMLSPRRERMSMPTIFCMQCKTLRAVNDWREQGDAFVIELDPCGHVAVRTARLEWVARSAAA